MNTLKIVCKRTAMGTRVWEKESGVGKSSLPSCSLESPVVVRPTETRTGCTNLKGWLLQDPALEKKEIQVKIITSECDSKLELIGCGGGINQPTAWCKCDGEAWGTWAWASRPVPKEEQRMPALNGVTKTLQPESCSADSVV